VSKSEVIGGAKLKAFTAHLRNGISGLRLAIGRRIHHYIKTAVIANFERKRPEWPDYQSAAYAAWRQEHGYAQMLVVHAALKGAIESGFDEEQGIVWCGIPGSADNKIAKIARAQEFGTPTVPERSYLRTGFNDARPKILAACDEETRKVVDKWS
jgi:hypothetical protein